MYTPKKRIAKFNLAFIIILFISFGLNAQKESNYSLLWKIEGNNLKAPSYLFGTMHIDDERAFNFSDAVLPAIKSCSKFALEVQPDSLIMKMIHKKSEEKAYLTYKKLLTDKEFKKLSKRFLEVNGYPIEESEEYDPNTLVTQLHPEENKDTDKATFVDLHLLGHAKTMQKEIIGLEDIDSQLNYFENLTKEDKREFILSQFKYDVSDYKKELEMLTKVYLTGDLNEINRVLENYDGYDLELEQRNKVMCNSIINQIKSGSLFSAVGAAHLPGSIGLINMLKEKGYIVTAVEANFTGVADNYQIDDSKMKWFNNYFENLGYAVETPGVISRDSSNTDFNVNTYVDFSSYKTYSFFAIDLRGQLTNDNKDLLINNIIDNTISNYDAISNEKKTVTINNIEGYEVLLTMNKTENQPFTGLRSVYLINNGMFYQLFVLGNIEDINSKGVDRFFNSIIFSEPKLIPIESKGWIKYVNDKGAFSIDFPGKPTDSSREVDSGIEGLEEKYKINMYFSSDKVSGDNYIVRYNDLPLGYRIEDLEASFEAMETTFLSKSELVSEPKTIYLDGYKGKEYEVVLKEISHAIIKLFFRGNRTYLLLSQKLNKDEKTDPNNAFFNSFKFEDYKKENILEHQKEDFSFKTLEDMRIDVDSFPDTSEIHFVKSIDYYSRNNQNGDMHSFGFSKIKPYFKIDTLRNFYDINKNLLMRWNDSIKSEKMIKVDNADALEFYLINKEDSIQSRHIIWLDNDYFFLSSAYAGKKTITNELTSNLLKSYKSKNRNQTIDYYASKTDRILTDLKSNDSLIFKSALGSFSYYVFEKNDLPKLYEALNYNYSPEENKTAVLSKIIEVLSSNNDENTMMFLETLYKNPSANDDIKIEILKLIPKLENENRLDVYKNLFFSKPPKSKNYYNYGLFRPFNDSIAFSLNNYKNLINLRNHKAYRREVLDISTNILESKNSDKNSIIEYFEQVTDSAFSDLNNYIKMLSEEEYDYQAHSLIYSYLNYLKTFPENGPFVDKFTKQLIEEKSNIWIQSNTAETRIAHNLKLPKEIKKSMLDSLNTRYDLIKAYHKANKLNEVPKNYLDQKDFSDLSLAMFLEDTDEYPTEKKLLGTIKHNNSVFYAYSLNYNYDNEKESYLSVIDASYAVSQNSELKAYECYTNWDLLNDDWKTQAKELIDESLKENED